MTRLQAHTRTRVAEALASGRRLCVACGGYHRIWGALRATGVVGGTAVDESVLRPTLARVGRGARRILVAGAADEAIVAVIARALPNGAPEIVVVDRCPAPLAEIAARADPSLARVETICADLARFTPDAPVDLVVSHSQIGFAPTRPARLEILSRLRNALGPGGTLVMVARTSTGLPVTPEEASAHARAWVERARTSIVDAGLADLYEPGELDALLTGFADGRAARSSLGDESDLVKLVREAGFTEVECRPVASSTRLPWQGGVHLKTSRLFLARRA